MDVISRDDYCYFEAIRIKHKYEGIEHAFHEGLARAWIVYPRDSGEIVYFHVRYDGTPAYSGNFKVLGDFYEGLAKAATKEDEEFHINRSGRPVYEKRYHSVDRFRNGLAKVYLSEKDRMNCVSIFIDHRGLVVDIDKLRSEHDEYVIAVSRRGVRIRDY